METLVTVIMPVYNAERYMRQSIESILAQTYQNWKLLMVDDGSTDSSADIMQEYCDRDSRVQTIPSTGNEGVASARNKGIIAAEGEYIAFLDSDDLWKPQKLETQINYMQEKNCGFVYS